MMIKGMNGSENPCINPLTPRNLMKFANIL